MEALGHWAIYGLIIIGIGALMVFYKRGKR
jgi:hypothetical protein